MYVCVFRCMYIWVLMYVCVCWCEKERDRREKDRVSNRQTDRQREKTPESRHREVTSLYVLFTPSQAPSFTQNVSLCINLPLSLGRVTRFSFINTLTEFHTKSAQRSLRGMKKWTLTFAVMLPVLFFKNVNYS